MASMGARQEGSLPKAGVKWYRQQPIGSERTGMRAGEMPSGDKLAVDVPDSSQNIGGEAEKLRPR